MGEQRYCDVCQMFKQDRIHRYGLSRQVKHEDAPTRRNGQRGYRRLSHFGGIDMCDECWDRIAKPKQRPELRGKTGPKRVSV